MRAIEVSLRSALNAMAIFEDGNWGLYGIIQEGSNFYKLDEDYDAEEGEQNFEDFKATLEKCNIEFETLELEGV